MKYITSFLILVFFMAGLTQKMNAQVNLAEVKKKEEERRKNTEKSKISINDSNIQKSGGGAKSSGFVQAQNAPATESTQSEKTPAEAGANQELNEEYWRTQRAELENRIRELEEAIARDETDLNKLWSDFYFQSDPVAQANIKAQISKATNQRDTNQEYLRQKTGELNALRDKARKAGIPPGWLR